MSRTVTHDGTGALQVRFPFDRALVDRIKSLPSRRWNAAERFWSVPESDVVSLVDLLRDDGFSFDEATRDLYRARGGSAVLRAAPRGAAPPTLPGLFDPVESDGPETLAAPSESREPGDYTVSRLNERVRGLIESAFPSGVWLVGEISGFNKSAHRRHVSFELVERAEGGTALSKIPATLFESTRREIERALRAAGEPFRLEDEIQVRMRVRVELYVPWGQYRVVVEELDARYTLGEAARRREEIVRRLAADGLIGVNSGLPLPALPLRVALITSLGSDAYNDVLRTLQESGFAFRVTAHGARVQGRSTEPSVLNALDWIRERAGDFDVVLICRGGGSRTDLVWFDSLALGRAVARFPLAVIVGIGHEQDQSVLDAVGRSAKTPTAAASLLVEAVENGLERTETLGESVLLAASRAVEAERRRQVEHGQRLVRAAAARTQRERSELAHRRRRTALAARALLGGARREVQRWSSLIPTHAAVSLERQRVFLAGSLRAVVHGARRDLGLARRLLRRRQKGLGPGGRRCVERERERMRTRENRLRLVDPQRVLDRGYSILRLAGGAVLTSARSAPPGTEVRAELKAGKLRLRSEGEGGD